MSVGIDNNAKDTGINFSAPDGGWGWIIVLSSLLIHVIMDGITYSTGQFLDVFVEDFNVTYGTVSFIHGLLPAVTLMCGPIGSAMTNRYGCRLTTIFGSLIAVVGFILTILVHNVYFLYFSIGIVIGVGFGMVYVPAIVAVGYYFERKRTVAMGIAVCGSGLGAFIFPPINRMLLNRYGWNGAFLVQAGIVLNICLCAMVMKPLSIEPSEILKRKRKLQKSLNNKSKTNEEEQELLKVEIGNKIAKIAESLPDVLAIEAKNSQRPYDPNHLCINPTDTSVFFKSLPQIVNNNEKLICTFEDALLRSYSSLNVLAHMRSNKSINDPKYETSKHVSHASDPNKDLNETKQIIMTNIANSAYDLHELKQVRNDSAPKDQDQEQKTFDLTILSDWIFLFFAISNFLTSLGFNAPYIFVVDQAKSYGISETNADWIIQTIGISNTIGRIVLGLLCMFERINRVYLYATVITICGIATVIEPFLRTFPLMILYASVFGFTSGGYVSMTSILLADLFGVENLSNSFGILLIFQGVATLIGPTTAGFMRDYFVSYTVPFVCLGIAIAISGLMCFIMPFMKHGKRQKNNDSTRPPA